MDTLVGSVAFWLTVTFVILCQSRILAGGSTYGSPDPVIMEKTTNESITLKWSSTGAFQYKLIWSDTSSDPAGEGYTMYTTFTIRKLLSGNLYSIFVKGCNEDRICSPAATGVSAVTEPNRPQNLRLAVDRANSLTASWTPGASVLDTIHTVTVALTTNGSEVDRHETQGTTYIRKDLAANTSYTVGVFSSVKDYPDTKGDMEKASTLTYPAAPDVKLIDTKKPYLTLSFHEKPARHYEVTHFDMDEKKKCMQKVHIVQNMNDTLPFLCDSECDAPPEKQLYPQSTFYNIVLNAEICGNYSATVYTMNSAGCSNGSTSYARNMINEFFPLVLRVQVSHITSTSLQLYVEPIYIRCNMAFGVSYFPFHCSCEHAWQCLGTIKPFTGFPPTSVLFDGLQPYTKYEFIIRRSSWETRTHPLTNQAEPVKPENVTYNENNGNLTWDLDCGKANGIIQYFAVSYSCHEQDRPFVISEEEQLNVTEQFLEIQFKPFRTCTVEVAGYTIGLGDVAVEIFNTSKEPGKVAVRIGARTFTFILLLWEKPESGLFINYTIQWKGSGSEEGSIVLSEADLSYLIDSLTPATDYTITVFATNKVGKGEKETFIVSTWTGLASPVTYLSVKVDEANALKLDVSWKKNEIAGPTEYFVCVSEKDDVVECRFHETVSAHESDEYESSFLVTNAFWDHAVHIMTIVEKWDGSTTNATSAERTVKTGKTSPEVVANLKAQMQDESDCRIVSVHWTALLPKEYNGMFKNYTVVAWVKDRHDSPFVAISVEDPQVTTAKMMLDGGRVYTIAIFATNDAYKGQRTLAEYETLACAPIIEDSGDDLVRKIKMPLADEQRTFAIAYDDILFRNDSFGKVELQGFIIRDVTENFQPAHKSRISRSEFEEKHQNKWIDYFGDDTQGYRIDLTDNGISKQSINKGNDFHEYLLGYHGKCDGYCNGYLKPSRNYKIQLFSCTSGGCLITGDSLVNIYTVGAKPVTTGPDVALITLGTFVGILLIAVIILVLRLRKFQGTKLANERTAIQEPNVPNDHTYDYIVDQFGTIRMVQKGTLKINEVNLKEMDGTSGQGRSIKGRDDIQHSCQGAQDYYNVASNGMKKTSETGPYESLKSIQIETYLKDPNCTQGQEMKEENRAKVREMEVQDIKNDNSKSGDDSAYTSLGNDKRNIIM